MTGLRSKVTLVILFGSEARGTAGDNSDVDLGVLADHPLTLKERTEIVGSLGKKLNVSEDRIDLVELRSASPLLQYQAARDGKFIVGEKSDFIRYQIRAWKLYLDTAKFRRAREQSLAQKYAK